MHQCFCQELAVLTDLRLTFRRLRKSPGFTLTAVVTLALGIGATTAIFSLVQQVMLKSLPVTKPNELYWIGDKFHCCNWSGYAQAGDFTLFSYEAYRRFKENTPGFSELTAFQADTVPLGVRRSGSMLAAEARNGEYVSGNFFRTFGVGSWIGRVLIENDDREAAPPVAVMSYHVWTKQYGSDPSVVGATYQLNGSPSTVVGLPLPDSLEPS
jgi:putative ABC transport system permease protein